MTGWLAAKSNQSSPAMASTRIATMATGSDEGATADSNSASIAANDFLTLLVTEMKNQDPTATTDPNEYVNQLVQVNSLQQLISINETLKGALSTTAMADAASSTSNVVDLRSAKSSSTSSTRAPEVDRAVGGNLGFSAKGPGRRA
jgi:flagellar basal-body rod modification protein FlgD